jgi:hypothetical protein
MGAALGRAVWFVRKPRRADRNALNRPALLYGVEEMFRIDQ